MSDIDPAILAAAQSAPKPQAPAHALEELKEKVRALRDATVEKGEIESRLRETNIAIDNIKFRTLPDLMDQIGIPSLELAPEGNNPGFVATVAPFYRANIAADWPEERREAAFKWLADNGHGDIVRRDVTVSFGKGEDAEYYAFIEGVRDLGYEPTVKQNVPWATLTAWLKEQVEKIKVTPPLDLLGATVGRVVNIKQKKD